MLLACAPSSLDAGVAVGCCTDVGSGGTGAWCFGGDKFLSAIVSTEAIL